jgi:MFS family permease
VWIVLTLFAGCGVAGGMLNSLIGTLVVTRTPDHVRGRVLATVGGTARGFSVLAMAIGGLGGQFLGTRATFVICGVLGVLAAAMVLRSHRGLAASVPVVEDASPVALQTA